MEDRISIVECDVVSDLEQAERLWRAYSREKGPYDTWELRMLFHGSESCEPHFIEATFSDGSKGLLALQQNKNRERFEVFGGVYMEESSVLPRELETSKKALLYQMVHSPCALCDLESSDPEGEGLRFEEYKYLSTLEGLDCADQFIERQFSGKTKNGFKKRIRSVKEKGVQVSYGSRESLQTLYTFNKKNFGEESTFCRPERQRVFDALSESPFQSSILNFSIDGVLGAVSLGLWTEHTYIYMNAGVDKEAFPNLGTFVIYTNIEEALKRGCLEFDAGVEDLGWKERWHLDKKELYQLLKS